MDGQEYYQTDAAIDMHHAPRFGHSSQIAFLASPYQSEQLDYVNGVLSFAFLLFMLFFMWGVLLVCFKCLGNNKAGCAAGGNVVDVQELRQDPLMKPKLERIILRSWRVQVTFLLTAFCIPIASGLFLVKGLKVVTKALLDVQNVNDDIETVAFRAMGITDSLIQVRVTLAREDIRAIADIENFCPNSQLMTNVSIFGDLGTNATDIDIKQAFANLDVFLNGDLEGAHNGFGNIATATRAVDDSAVFVYENDWMLKMFALVLNVIVGSFMLAICLSRSNYIHPPFRAMLVYFLVPIFCILMLLTSIATLALAMATVTNADFCAGGDYPGSPKGTVREVVEFMGLSETIRIYDTFQYYVEGCQTENPLHFIQPYQQQLKSSIESANNFLNSVVRLGTAKISDQCGGNIEPIVGGVKLLVENLVIIQGNMVSALALSECSSIAPILRRIFQGEPCNTTIIGLTWMFWSLFAISVFGMTLLSLRAAMYNATIKALTKERTDIWEWDEYKQYMTGFYNDAKDWRFHGSPNKQGGRHNAASFEPSLTAKPSLDNDDFDDEHIPDQNVKGRWLYPDDAMMEEILHDHDIDNISDASIYTSPDKYPKLRPMALEEMNIQVKTRSRYNESLDGAVQPFDPLHTIKPYTQTPTAPRKTVKSIQRTSLGVLISSKPIPQNRDLI